MGLETGSNIADLVITNPLASDPKSAGDDHLRLIKTILKNAFAGFTGAIIVTGTDTGTAAAHVLTPTTPLVAYATGLMVLYRPVNAGIGALTVNISALGVKSVKTLLGADPTSGDITANQPLLLMYDGTNFVIVAGSGLLSKTGNQALTGNLTLTGNQTISGTLAVSGALTGASMDAKGDVSGEVWSGPHDFTAANITVPTPTLAAQAVTKAYADGLAFSSALPGQSAATVGQVVISDGAAAYWGDAGAVGSDIYLYNNF
jgi:hypothetical protein